MFWSAPASAFTLPSDAARRVGFEAAIREIPLVMECLLITGQTADTQIEVVVRNMDAFRELLLDRITRIPGVRSSFVLRWVVDKTALSASG